MPRKRRTAYPEIDAVIGANLRRFRVKLDWSQGELGDKLGVTFQQIQKYERGSNRISASTLYKASKIMKVQIVDFYDGLDVGTGKSAALSKEEAKVLRLYMQISDEDIRRSVMQMMKSFTSRQADVPESLAN